MTETTINNKTLEKLKYELVRDGIVSYETLEKAEELANSQSVNIGHALVTSGVLSEETLLKFLESKLHLPYVNLEDYHHRTHLALYTYQLHLNHLQCF